MTAALGSALGGARGKAWRKRARGGYRPGRKKPGRPRAAEGPTAEVLLRRVLLAGGEARIERGKLVVLALPTGDPAQTATALDVLETRGMLSPDLAAAGRAFARDHTLIFGSWPPGVGRRGDGRPPSIPALERAEAGYAAALDLLDAAGAEARGEVIAAAIDELLPRCLTRADSRATRELAALRAGLASLLPLMRERLPRRGLVRRAR